LGVFAVGYALKTKTNPSPAPDEERQLPGVGKPPEPLAIGEDTGAVGALLDEFQAFLESEGVAQFTSAREFLRLPSLSGTKYAVPPKSLWANAIPTLQMFQAIRRKAGVPIPLRGYRPPAYNETVAGADRSMHQWLAAVDMRPQSNVEDIALLAALEVIARPDDTPGLGVYGDPPRSLHLDTGYRARSWDQGGAWLRRAQQHLLGLNGTGQGD